MGSFEVRALFEGAERMRCEQPAAKTPLEIEELRRICRGLQRTPHAVRNRAILTLGFGNGELSLRQQSQGNWATVGNDGPKAEALQHTSRHQLVHRRVLDDENLFT